MANNANNGVMRRDSLSGLIVNECYKLGRLIGSGSFGEIRQAVDSRSKELVAIKLVMNKEIKDKDKIRQLELEFKYYQIVGSEKVGFPKVFHFGQWNQYDFLVMELLGRNLDDVFDVCKRQFSLKTIVLISLQLLRLIEHVHNCHLVYRDIKPENFVLGLDGSPKANLIHILDFGLAKQYIDPNTKTHIPLKEGKTLIGTARYMSINAHLGKEQSRRDDLESIGYMIMYFVKQGRLPWTGLKASNTKERYIKIGNFKRGTSIETLCYGHSEQFANYLRYVRQLDFETDPNYETMKNMFFRLYEKEKFADDGVYDWNNY